VELWTFPSSSARFGIHPAGVHTLYSRSRTILVESGVLDSLTDAERKQLGADCWRVAGAVFRPGGAIRSGVERLLDGNMILAAVVEPDDEEARLRAQRVAYLAAWAVCRAACDWAGQG